MLSITTKFMSATNFKGSRIKATSTGGKTVTVSYDHSLPNDGAHDCAAEALACKLGWNPCTLHRGVTATGNVYVLDDDESLLIVD